MGILSDAASNLDWSHIEPAIFGTLFERSLDADKRSLIGAHYTSSADILLLIEPVVMQPLRRRWAEIKGEIEAVLEAERTATAAKQTAQSSLRARGRAEDLMSTWLDELTAVTVLDPACGSGNFLYIAIQQLLDLWKESKDFALAQGLAVIRQGGVSPRQLFGIETDFYAHELASMVVWIGYLQWMHQHGEPIVNEPVLENLDNIERGDAILRYDEEGKAYEPEWHAADYIVGNPPFLGGKLLRRELGNKYIDDLFTLYKGRVKAESDLVVYWFEKARAQLEAEHVERVGLLATQAIRGGANRDVLKRIKGTGDIFYAWSDRAWTLDGAAVRVSMVAFDRGAEAQRSLDGQPVDRIHSNLDHGVHVSSAVHLVENDGICFQGTIKVGNFDLDQSQAQYFLNAPVNVNGRPNSDVVVPWANADDVTGRSRGLYIIDFGPSMTAHDASLYELPFEYLKTEVKPVREKVNRKNHRERWWIHAEARPGMRNALAPLTRYIVTPRVAKHRFFVWEPIAVLPDSRLFTFARGDGYFFGCLHSVTHEIWSLRQASWHGVGNDPTYNVGSCFDTFPFPWPPGHESQDDPRVQAIAAAAKHLVELRDHWLNPPDTPEEELKKRTLTNLYNKRPQWLDDAHRTLDHAVFAAYGWPNDLSEQQLLEKLLALNHERAAAQEPLKPKNAAKKAATTEPTASESPG